MVGRNPGILDLALGLTGSGTDDLRARLEETGFHTAGVVVLTIPGPWAEIAYGAARMETYWSPHA
ncbi:hypothetical protein OG871_37385 [Kitasatospora sp. NBC_00374]|uniref:hypothetical protein n=1 Tax=Kitasatospora sp. NBC_00374 TaxID=2975964 RepID=UPI003253EB8D